MTSSIPIYSLILNVNVYHCIKKITLYTCIPHNKLNHLRLHFLIFALKQQTQGFAIKLISNIESISIIYKHIKYSSSHQYMIRSQQYSTKHIKF